MNFLAHAFLSFEIGDILTGNMITDFLHGHHKEEYDQGIQTGISLHYEIDAFTDAHPATLRSKEIFRPATGRYCGVFQDVIYDYFLANDAHYFEGNSLAHFSQEVYKTIEKREAQLPPDFNRVFAAMKKEDWLYHYRTPDGIHHSFNGIFRRAAFLEKNESAFEAFLKHKKELREAYRVFIPDMVKHAKEFLNKKGYSINS